MSTRYNAFAIPYMVYKELHGRLHYSGKLLSAGERVFMEDRS